MAGQDHVRKVDIVSGGQFTLELTALILAIAPLHPFGQGPLTQTGKQWSDEVETTDENWTEVESITITPDQSFDFKEIEFALTLQLKSTGATKDAQFKWQARNSEGTWVDICAAVTYAANASAYKEYSVSGRFPAEENFSTMPIDIRAVVKREDAAEEVVAQVSNSSYVSIIYY